MESNAKHIGGFAPENYIRIAGEPKTGKILPSNAEKPPDTKRHSHGQIKTFSKIKIQKTGRTIKTAQGSKTLRGRFCPAGRKRRHA